MRINETEHEEGRDKMKEGVDDGDISIKQHWRELKLGQIPRNIIDYMYSL